MDDNLNEQVGVLKRREIEARILKPFVEAVGAELGHERTRELLQHVVIEAAEGDGYAMRGNTDSPGLIEFAQMWEPWFRGGALEIEEIERNEARWYFNVTRCRYAELYKELGLEQLGGVLSCNRDAALIKGYHSSIELKRTQTLMEGADCCDFRYERGQSDEAC
ncbi:MAG: L-2-amino-thiazoline-4-carboxylic acid hydrolase [Trueperaceae bacterium]|nr:MAG: L-2-amino-thiazoline-4-carboxylic acid hydrolase [Trueperaceae bacterium]